MAMLTPMTLKVKPDLGSPPAAYRKLLAGLLDAGWFCHGTVTRRTLRRKVAGQWVDKGPYYLWTAKHQGKTVCRALSQSQYETAKEAIATNRRVMETVAKLQAMTLEKILNKLPGVQKRK
jgi:hypothetical protein